MSRTWAELVREERIQRKYAYDLLAEEHDIHTATTVAQLRADKLWNEAVYEVDPTDGFWHERMAEYIADRW